MWRPRRPAAEWEAAQLAFVRESDRGGRWETGKRAARPAPDEWTLSHRGATLRLRPTPFKHVGLFHKQSANWRFTAGRIAAAKARGAESFAKAKAAEEEDNPAAEEEAKKDA